MCRIYIHNGVEASHNGVQAEATENNANTDRVTQSDTDTMETENATGRVSASLEGDYTIHTNRRKHEDRDCDSLTHDHHPIVMSL